MGRESWDEYFMGIASLVKTRSTCTRRQVGALAVMNNRILCSGYNGAPIDHPHCKDVGCYREQHNIPSGTMHEKCRAIHAEQNLIIQAAKFGVSMHDCTVYVTNKPCIICAKMLVNIPISKLIYLNDYPDKDTDELLLKAFRWALQSPDGKMQISTNYYC